MERAFKNGDIVEPHGNNEKYIVINGMPDSNGNIRVTRVQSVTAGFFAKADGFRLALSHSNPANISPQLQAVSLLASMTAKQRANVNAAVASLVGDE